MKKQLISILLLLTIALTACSQNTGATATKENKVLKLGINGDENKIWKNIKEQLAKEGITLEIVSFSDYIVPNTALADGEIDANAFQTEIFFDNYREQSGTDLSILGYTILAPMGIYPGTSKTLAEIPENSKIAIPNDPSNGGRALVLLDAAGIIEIDKTKGLLPTVKDVLANPKQIEIVEMAPAQIPAALDELAVACINNGVARDSGLSPLEDSIFIEDTSLDYVTAYYNIIAVQTGNLEKPELKRLLEIYQSDENRELIKEFYNGSAIPAF